MVCRLVRRFSVFPGHFEEFAIQILVRNPISEVLFPLGNKSFFENHNSYRLEPKVEA